MHRVYRGGVIGMLAAHEEAIRNLALEVQRLKEKVRKERDKQ